MALPVGYYWVGTGGGSALWVQQVVVLNAGAKTHYLPYSHAGRKGEALLYGTSSLQLRNAIVFPLLALTSLAQTYATCLHFQGLYNAIFPFPSNLPQISHVATISSSTLAAWGPQMHSRPEK